MHSSEDPNDWEWAQVRTPHITPLWVSNFDFECCHFVKLQFSLKL